MIPVNIIVIFGNHIFRNITGGPPPLTVSTIRSSLTSAISVIINALEAVILRITLTVFTIRSSLTSAIYVTMNAMDAVLSNVTLTMSTISQEIKALYMGSL